MLSGASVAQRLARLPAAGVGDRPPRRPPGDWDLALYDRADRQAVAGSTFFGASEVAQGIARRAGAHRPGLPAHGQQPQRSHVASTATAPEAPKPPTLSLVRVSAPNARARQQLADSASTWPSTAATAT